LKVTYTSVQRHFFFNFWSSNPSTRPAGLDNNQGSDFRARTTKTFMIWKRGRFRSFDRVLRCQVFRKQFIRVHCNPSPDNSRCAHKECAHKRRETKNTKNITQAYVSIVILYVRACVTWLMRDQTCNVNLTVGDCWSVLTAKFN